MSNHSYSLQWIAEHIGGTIDRQFNLSKTINALASIELAGVSDISFIESEKYLDTLCSIKGATVIIRGNLLDANRDSFDASLSFICHPDPYLAFAILSKLFDSFYQDSQTAAIDETAKIASNAKIGAKVTVGANAVIEDDCIIGDNVVIGANCTIGKNSAIGKHCFIHPNAVVYHDSVMGEHCMIHSGAVIGGDGFGLAMNEKGQPVKIYHLGRVVLGNHVEVGCNSTIDRGVLNDTQIHDYVKIDNQVQIGHNCIIGECTRIVSQVAMAGSVTVGKYCVIAGQAAIAGHITIADRVIIFGQAGVSGSILKAGEYGSRRPLLEKNEMLQAAVAYKYLPEMRKQLKLLTKKLVANE